MFLVRGERSLRSYCFAVTPRKVFGCYWQCNAPYGATCYKPARQHCKKQAQASTHKCRPDLHLPMFSVSEWRLCVLLCPIYIYIPNIVK